MKPQKKRKKLVFNKETVADLNSKSMSNVYGGCVETKTASCTTTRAFILSVCFCPVTDPWC
jgi:natural product precursor